MIVIGKTMRTIGIMPFQLLGRCWMIFTILTLIPMGTVAQIGRTPKHWQVSDRYPFIPSVQFRDPFPAFAARGSCFYAFNRDDDFTTFTRSGLYNPNIG